MIVQVHCSVSNAHYNSKDEVELSSSKMATVNSACDQRQTTIPFSSLDYVPASLAAAVIATLYKQVHDLLGNAWEWVEGGDPTRRTLRGGSYVDFDPLLAQVLTQRNNKQPANHAITPGTRMETTQDSGSANTSFRCASDGTNRQAGIRDSAGGSHEL